MRALFHVVAPIAAFTFLIALKTVKNVGTKVYAPIDTLSITMSVLGFGGLLYGVSSIATDGWNNPIVLTTIIVGVIFIALFVWRQYQLDVPLLNFEVLKISNLPLD